MLILGGGIIGLEMGTVYSTLGARLDVVEMLDGLMQGADRDLVKIWQKMAKRFGLINTMVFTHVPSNLLLVLVPLMPNLPLAIGLLLARFSLSQMDVPTRQSYTMAVVSADERSAAAGVTGIARSVGASLSPALTGIFLANPALLSVPFFLCGGLKLVYDLALYRSFSTLKPPEENMGQTGAKFL